MKRKIAVLTAALMIMVLAAGCRSKGNDNKTPSTTTVPTTMPTTQSTTVPETETTTDSTIPSGNGPIDETTVAQTDGTDPESTGNGTVEGAAGNASRSGMSPNNGSKANTGR